MNPRSFRAGRSQLHRFVIRGRRKFFRTRSYCILQSQCMKKSQRCRTLPIGGEVLVVRLSDKKGIHIPIRSEQTVSSTEIACGVDKPLENHLETTMKQEVGSKVQVCKGLGRSYRADN
ncbi:hypothetical protein NIES932_16640 [Raphidiopsis curvata NIES-932]|nr:hypothetical protein NIES932_16640 [Raphidiopsis curvata NIES-932]